MGQCLLRVLEEIKQDTGVPAIAGTAVSQSTVIDVAAVSHSMDLAAALATNAGDSAVMQGIKRIIACFT